MIVYPHTPTPTPATDFRRAAIDFVLANGRCSEAWRDARDVLPELAHRGVDYDRSGDPSFDSVMTDCGDTETEATYASAYSVDVVPVGAREDARNGYTEVESYTFYIDPEVLSELTVGFLVRALVAEGGSSWKTRF